MKDREYDPVLFPTTGIKKDVGLATEEMKHHGINTAAAGINPTYPTLNPNRRNFEHHNRFD